MMSYWSSRYGHACPAINYFKVTFFGAFIIWTESVLPVSGCFKSCILLYVCPGCCMSWFPFCWLKFQSIFNGLQSIATDDEKHYQCQTIVSNNKTGPLFLEFNWWIQSLFAPIGDRDIVESADKGMKVFDTGQFDFYFVSVSLFELVVLLSDSFTVVPKSWA